VVMVRAAAARPVDRTRCVWIIGEPLMTLTTDLGLSIRVYMSEYVRRVRETSDWDLFLF